MQILSHHQVQQKIKRLAYEILEDHYEAKTLFVVGINDRGYSLASLLIEHMQRVVQMEYRLLRLHISPQSPLDNPIYLEEDVQVLKGQHVLLVDDVANSGRTFFYACKPLMDVLPASIDTVVLVDRMHKLYPIQTNHVGISLATTLQDNITVEILDPANMGAFLD